MMNYIDNYSEGNPKFRRKLPWIMGAILILAIGASAWINLRPGVYVGDDFLYRKRWNYYVNGGNEIRITNTDGNTTFSTDLFGEKKIAEITWKGGEPLVEFDDGEIVTGNWGVWNGEEYILDEENLPIVLEEGMTIVVNNEIEQRQVSNKTLANILCRIDSTENWKGVETKGHWAFILIGAIAYLIGMACFYFPEETALLFTRWKYDYVELSDMALFAEKAGGVAAMVIGVVMIFHLIPF